MYIPMIFFTIIIEKRNVSPERRAALHRQQMALQEMETQRMWKTASLPEYCTRI